MKKLFYFFNFLFFFAFYKCFDYEYFNDVITPYDLFDEFDESYYQFYSFTNLTKDYNENLKNISIHNSLQTYIYYIEKVDEKYNENNLKVFMDEFVNLLNFTEDTKKNCCIIVISVNDKKIGINMGSSYEEKFTKSNKYNLDKLKDLVLKELKYLKDYNSPIEILIKTLENGLKPINKFYLIIFIMIFIISCLIGIIIISTCCRCCCLKNNILNKPLLKKTL